VATSLFRVLSIFSDSLFRRSIIALMSVRIPDPNQIVQIEAM